MMWLDIKLLENTVSTLVENNINSIEQLKKLTDEDLLKLNGVGVKKLKEIKNLIQTANEIDVFENFGPQSIRSTSNIAFFHKNQIYQGNVLQNKLVHLSGIEKLTKGKVTAFLDFKHAVLRKHYNHSLSQEIIQTKDHLYSLLQDLAVEELKAYLSSETVDVIKDDILNLIKATELEQVDLDKYGHEIIKKLDIEYFLIQKTNNFNREILYQVIYKARKEISLFTLKQKLLEAPLFNMNELPNTLQLLMKEGFIVYTSRGVKHQYPSIVQYLESNLPKYELTLARLKGKTLEEIGQREGVTRERIRQKVKRESSDLPVNRFYEYRFLPYLEQYELTQEEFCYIFQLSLEQYNFLKLLLKPKEIKYKLSKEELMDSDQLDHKERECLLQILNKDYVIIDNHRVQKTKVKIVEYALSIFAQNSIGLEEFQWKLIEFCKQNGIADEFDFTENRALESVVLRAEKALWKYGKEVRYYPIDQAEVLYFIAQVNFERYKNQEISAHRILDDYSDVIQEIDIRDEYELHNLLKRNEKELPKNVRLTRMPLLEIGNGNREEQLLDLLIEHSPISKKDLAVIYSDKYGVLLKTVEANYVSLLNEYETESNLLDADTPAVSERTLHNLRDLLTEDFYFKEDIYSLYKEKYGDDQLRDYIFPLIGYTNYADFILSSKYSRADHYFTEKYFNKPMFRIKDNRLKYLGGFRKTLESYISSFDLFEFGKNEFINFEVINKKTMIQKDDIKQLIIDILGEVGDKYFTIPMIEPLIEKSPLNILGFDDVFYESILKGYEELRYQYMGGRTVFRKVKDKFYIYQFVEEIMGRLKQIDVYELIDYFNDTYFVSLPKEKILEATKLTSLYYHPVLEIMFQDIEQFYEFMEED